MRISLPMLNKENAHMFVLVNIVSSGGILLDFVGKNEYNMPTPLGLLSIVPWIYTGKQLFLSEKLPKAEINYIALAFLVVGLLIVLALVFLSPQPSYMERKMAWDACMNMYSQHPDACGGVP